MLPTTRSQHSKSLVAPVMPRAARLFACRDGLLELTGGFGLPDDLDRSFEVLVATVIAGVKRLAAPAPGE